MHTSFWLPTTAHSHVTWTLMLSVSCKASNCTVNQKLLGEHRLRAMILVQHSPDYIMVSEPLQTPKPLAGQAEDKPANTVGHSPTCSSEPCKHMHTRLRAWHSQARGMITLQLPRSAPAM